MSEKKYSLLTEKEIEQGIESGIFKKENVAIVRNSDGAIVKHLKSTDNKVSIISSTIVQINNTVIYQADMQAIIAKIIETKNSIIFYDLSESYQILIGRLNYYKIFNDGLGDLNLKALDLSSKFGFRTEQYVRNINTKNLTTIDGEKFVNMLKTQVSTLFIYIISAFWLHDKKIADDKAFLIALSALKNQVRGLFEQLLAPSSRGEDGVERITLDNSAYAQYFYKKDNFQVVENFLRYDSRFQTLASFMNFITRCYLKNTKYHDDYGRLVWVDHLTFSDRAACREFEIRDFLIASLVGILDDIVLLDNVFDELLQASEKIDSKFREQDDVLLAFPVMTLLSIHDKNKLLGN